MLRDTSIVAFEAVRECGFIGETAREVYVCLYNEGPQTQNEVWKKVGGNRKKDSYGPRFVLLQRLGLINDLGTRLCTVTNRVCHYYDVTSTVPPKRTVKPAKPRKFWIIIQGDEMHISMDKDVAVQFFEDQKKRLLDDVCPAEFVEAKEVLSARG